MGCFSVFCEFELKRDLASRKSVLEKTLNHKSLVAFRAKGVRGGYSSYRSYDLDPGKLFF